MGWCKDPDRGLPAPDKILFLDISVEDAMKVEQCARTIDTAVVFSYLLNACLCCKSQMNYLIANMMTTPTSEDKSNSMGHATVLWGRWALN